MAAAARAAGLQFVILTDHNNVDAKPFQGYHDGVLVLVGSELSSTKGHILGLGIPDPAFRFSGDARDVLEDIRDLGGQALAAHPLSPREDFRWTGWDEPGPWGLEVLNGDSQWREASWGRRIAAGGLYVLNKPYALLASLSAPTDALARWDALLAQRDVVGIAGADAHGRLAVRKEWAVPFPSYESVFAVARNHVLLDRPLAGDAGADGTAVLQALGRGRSYVGLDVLAPAGGFFFVAEDGARRWTMGDTVPPHPWLRLRAGGQVPAGTRMTLLRDGRPVEEGPSLDVVVPGPGVYRVEARVGGREMPWVISNPIYVFDAVTAQVRAQRAAWPAAETPPAAAVVLDSFEGKTTFAPEFDESSSVESPIAAAGAARLKFRLGTPGPGRPHVWCALVSRQPRDLSGRTGLVFALKGDGAYRLWVQLRDENPASADEGVESWFASVRTTSEWRRIAIPFARMRSLNRRTDGRLNLDKIRHVVFVLDPGSVKPGTAGTIWLDEVGAY